MAEVKITITGEDQATKVFKAVEVGAEKAEKGIQDFGQTCAFSTGKAQEFIKGLIGFEILKQAGRWVKDLGASFLEAASTSEQYETRLKVLLGSAEEGNRLFKDMADFASRVPFQYEEIMGSATMLSGVMKGGVDEINRWMPMIGDLAAASGLTIQETTEQVQRMYSAGAASADKFRERGILSMLGFKAGVSYSVEETKKKMFDAWEAADSKFRGATDELAKTWEGLTSMLGDKWFQFRTKVMDSAPFDYLKGAVRMFNDYLDSNAGAMDRWAEDLGETIVNVAKAGAMGAAWLIDSWRGLKMVWQILKIAGLEFEKFMVSSIDFMARKITDAMEFYNVGGVFDEQIAALKTFSDTNARQLGIVGEDIDKAKRKLINLAYNVSAVDKMKDTLATLDSYVSRIREESDESGKQLGTNINKGAQEAIAALKELGFEAEKTGAKVKSVGGGSGPGTPGGEVMGPGVIHFGWEAPAGPQSLEQLKSEAATIAERMGQIKLGDINSAAAVEELGQLQERLGVIKGQLAEIQEPHLKMDAMQKELNTLNEAFIQTEKLIERPKRIDVDHAEAVGKIEEFSSRLASIPDKTVTVRVNYEISDSGMQFIDERLSDMKRRGTSRFASEGND